MVTISRRHALLGTLAASASGCSGDFDHETLNSSRTSASGAFAHGVASGDPTATSLILWTRVSPDDGSNSATIAVAIEISTSDSFETIVATADLFASPASDWTIKYDAKGLIPGTTYYFRFRSGDNLSATGRGKTLPEGNVSGARFAVVSCSSWQHGYFNAYDHIARNTDFDAVIHLGDYFYEYGSDGYGSEIGTTIDRLHEPAHEVLTLDDYRQRHAQYKSDPSLQAAHAAHTMISLWDDHEVANNSWEGGAENHQISEGDWETRRKAAMQAYYEWMPVRDPEPGKTREALYRSYQWGDLLTLVSIETRLTARAKQIEIDEYTPQFTSLADVDAFMKNIVGADDRYLLGDVQLEFVTTELKKSKDADQPWRLVANQILMADVRTPDLTPYLSEEVVSAIEPQWAGIRDFVKNSSYRLPLYIDTWGGYPFARERFYDNLSENGINDIVVLTGDAHEFWVNDLYTDDNRKMGVELGTTSVTSQTVEAFIGTGTKDYALLMTRDNECVRYYDPMHHGYIDLELTPKRGTAKLVAVDTVTSRDYTAYVSASFDLKRKDDTVSFKSPKGLGLKERFVY